ncbi:MAG: sigma-70 family RNA polymerase sigma factor [Planctomycetota bacterium]
MKDAALTRLFVRFRDRADGRALAKVFDATARDLLAIAAHLVRDLDEAEDLVQSTFRVAIERAATFDRDRSLQGWLYGILCKEAARARRRAARRVEHDGVEISVDGDPLDAAIAAEVPQILVAAIERLDPPYREVVRGVVVEERSSRDVARSLGRAPGTVRVQLQRGLERLRAKLPREFGTGGLPALLPGVALERLRANVLRDAGAHVARRSVPLVAAAGAGSLATLGALAVAGVVLGATVLVAVELAGPSVETSADATESRGTLGESVALATVEPAVTRETGSNVIAVAPTGSGSGREAVPLRPSIFPDDPQVVGRVVDESGAPVGRVVVVVHPANVDLPDREIATFVTDDDGRFAFAELEPGHIAFTVDDRRFARVTRSRYTQGVEAAPEEPAQVELRLFAPRSLDCVVVDGDGRAVGGARVTLAREFIEDGRPVQGHLTQVLEERTERRRGLRPVRPPLPRRGVARTRPPGLRAHRPARPRRTGADVARDR